LGMTRAELLASADFLLSEGHLRQYRELLRRRLEREPIAYLTGRREFWSLEFGVLPDVLIPRPETERLVEIALALARELPQIHSLPVLDIGTGSGAIAVSLAKELPSAVIWATDVSPAALEIARRNATCNGVAERVRFFQGDLFKAIGESAGRFALIVSNPPYLTVDEFEALEPAVKQFEPAAALVSGDDGLGATRRLLAGAKPLLEPGGMLVLEIDERRADRVRALASEHGWRRIGIHQDLFGRPRYALAFPGEERL